MAKEPEQISFLGLEDTEKWRDEWQDMPEFIQEKQDIYCSIIVRFKNEDDLKDFAKLINQKLTPKSSIWHPKLEWNIVGDRRWVDENNE